MNTAQRPASPTATPKEIRMAATTVVESEVTRAERDLYLAELERMVCTEYNAHHEDSDWDKITPVDRYRYAFDFGLDGRAAHAVAHLTGVPR